MLAYLLAVSLMAEIDRTKPVVYFINQNPTAAYYGNPASRYFADNGYSVVATYMRMDNNRSVAFNPVSLRYVIEDIKAVNPDIIFVMGTGFSRELRTVFDSVVIFNLVPGEYDIHIENPMRKLLAIVDKMEINRRFYLLRDETSKSYRFSVLYKALLEAEGVDPSNIEIVSSSNTVELEKNLRRLNGQSQSVLINCMYMLRDVEQSKDRYIDDIKQVITRVNRVHMDVGAYVGYGRNTEALVLQIDYRNMDLRGEQAVAIAAYFNPKRLAKLGLEKNYLRSFSLVDGVIDE